MSMSNTPSRPEIGARIPGAADAGGAGHAADPALTARHAALDMLSLPAGLIEEFAPDAYRVLHLNDIWRQICGRAAEEVWHLSLEEVFAPRLSTVLSEQFAQCRAAGGMHGFEETMAIGGRETWWQVHLRALPPEPGTALRMSVVLSPLTEYRNRALGDAAQISRLTALNAEIRDLTGLAAHDLRTPLANIVSLAALGAAGDIVLQGDGTNGDGIVAGGAPDSGSNARDAGAEDETDPGTIGSRAALPGGMDAPSLLRICGASAEKGLEELDGILARIDALDLGQTVPEEVALGDLCRRLALQLDPRGNRRISWPDAVLRTDRILLSRALHNLLDNALRHARSQIRITLLPVPEGRPARIELLVSDDGPGFAGAGERAPGREAQDPAGLRAARAALPRPGIARAERQSEGSGRQFGLASVARLLEAHGGYLGIEPPRRAGGAHVRLGLPGERIARPPGRKGP